MAAETLNCPMCGAPVASLDSPQCDHCGARLATVACPSCFGMIFQGAKFCSHCGAKVERVQVAETSRALCPRCSVDMNTVAVGTTNLRECSRCEGIWLNKASFEQICSDSEKQSALLGMASHLPEMPKQLEQVRYLPCPVCASMMNRVNFAHCSHVIVDVCREHGTWFDRDELRQIVEFIRAGGLNQARAIEAEELKSEVERLKESRQRLQTGTSGGGWSDGSVWGGGGSDWSGAKYEAIGLGVCVAAQVLKTLFRR